MKICKTLALPLGGALLASAASAQIVYGTSNASNDDNYLLDVGTTASAGPVFTGERCYGLADDDTNQLLYVSDEGMISSWGYGTAVPTAFVVAAADAGGAGIRCEAMAHNAGTLYAVDEFGGTPLEGIYSIDLVTGLGTEELIYSTPADLDVGGLDVDPATGLFYGSSDVASGRGIVTLDIVADTETIISAYPGTLSDIDGLAFNPNGTVYLIQDEAQPIDVFDVATLTYTGTLPTAVPVANTFSAGTWSDVLSGPTGSIGSNYCMAENNSTGVPATMSAEGSLTVADNDVTLTASDLPLNQFGIFVTSMDQAFVPGAGGTSNGNICLGGAIGRYQAPSQILSSGATGEFSLTINLPTMPQGAGSVAVMNGDTWNFQAWYRDGVGLGSNFTDGLQIDFN